MTRPQAAVTILSAAAVLTLCACGGPGTPEITPAPSASDPGCAALVSRLPQRLLNRPRGTTDAAGTAVWGSPAIVLRCGVTPPGPSADRCIGVNDADWLFTEDKSAYHFVSFGRRPAVELTVPSSVDRTTAPGALAELGSAIAPLTVTGHCVSLDGS